MKLWSRTRLHIGWSDLAAGALACVVPSSREALAKRVESYWPQESTLVCFSVRSGFDLLLQALNLEQDDEVIFSALNVKGMINIARRAGLVPVPLDFDASSVTPSVETLKRAISPRSKVLVIAHLFGCRLEIDGLIAAAHSAGLLVVEDCAQAFSGKEYSGHPASDLCMFSFGPLKTSTALGGALINIRNSELLEKMRAIQEQYPVQPTTKQAKRILQFAGFKLLTPALIFGLVQRGFAIAGQDYEDAIANKVRNVAVLKAAKNLRFRPSGAMLVLMRRRLETFDAGSLKKRTATGNRLKELLGAGVVLPGQGNTHHDYWVFPIAVDQPKQFISQLRAVGFDAANLPRSQAVSAPANRPELEPDNAAELLSRLVIVPCYQELPVHELQRLSNAVHEALGSAESFTDEAAVGAHGEPAPNAWWKPGSLHGIRRRLIRRFGKRLIRRFRGFLASQSLVSNEPVLDPGQFPFLEALETHWQEIHAELLKVLEFKESIPALEELSSDQRKIARGRQWRTFILYGFGEKVPKNCAFTPRTTELLEKVPHLQTAWFSIMEPGYQVPPHKGVTKGILRCHLGLIIPDDRQNCWIRIDQEKCIWQPGKIIVFDDTYKHEVKNDTSQERAVLLVDFERPMRFWGKLFNRSFISLLKLTAYYQEPKKAMRSFQENFEAAVRRSNQNLENLSELD